LGLYYAFNAEERVRVFIMDTINVIGPGISSLDYEPREGDKTLAFQEVFPNCIEHLGIIPDYWTFADPNAALSGFSLLLDKTSEHDKYKNIKILVPDVFFESLAVYRMYFGTTPLMRIHNGWEIFQDLLKRVSELYDVISIPVTTTKYIQVYEKQSSELKQLFEHEYIRFMSDKVIFGTVKFDSESVVGDRYKWGLENKLTSSVLPICSFLRAKKLKIYGFDYIGPRFYSDIERHPWSNNPHDIDDRVQFSLSLLKKWLLWYDFHGIKIVSGTKNKNSLPNTILASEE